MLYYKEIRLVPVLSCNRCSTRSMTVPPIGWVELLIIFGIVILIFGPKRLKNLGSEIGNSIKGFRNAMKDQDQDQEDSKVTTESTTDQNSEQDPQKQTHA